jgi:hypothetical protein
MDLLPPGIKVDLDCLSLTFENAHSEQTFGEQWLFYPCVSLHSYLQFIWENHSII